MKMALYLARSYEEVFLKIAGKRHLHPMEFDKMIGQLRSMFWNYRLVDTDYSRHGYVREVIPIGSVVFNHGDYMLPDGRIVSSQIRERVRLLDQRYREILTY